MQGLVNQATGLAINGAVDVNEIIAQDVLKGDVLAKLFSIPDAPVAVKLANPAPLPAGSGTGCAFSPDGVYLSVSHGTTPFVTIYKRAGDVFTKLANPAALPPGFGLGCAFSPDGVYLSVAHDITPFVTIYKRAGDVFTKLADPAALPTGYGFDCAFSPDGIYLSVAHDVTPFVTIYSGLYTNLNWWKYRIQTLPYNSVSVGISAATALSGATIKINRITGG